MREARLFWIGFWLLIASIVIQILCRTAELLTAGLDERLSLYSAFGSFGIFLGALSLFALNLWQSKNDI